jgi:hypothetical protein
MNLASEVVIIAILKYSTNSIVDNGKRYALVLDIYGNERDTALSIRSLILLFVMRARIEPL